MNFLRGLAVILGTTLLSLFLFLAIVGYSVNVTFGKPDNLKRWLAESKVYNGIVQAAIDSSTKNKEQGTSSSDFAQPEVQAALKQAITPAFLQKSAEAFLDGTYSWLEGKTTKPSYSIDLTPVKTAFATNLAASAQARLASLPPCTVKNQPATTDPFAVTCRPPASVSDPQIQKMIDDIINGNAIGGNTITADTQDIGNKTADNSPASGAPAPVNQPPAQPWYVQLKRAPQIYSWSQRGPYIFGFLALLGGAMIVFASHKRRHGLMIVAGTTLTVGVFLAASAELSLFAFRRLGTTVAQNKDTPSLGQPMSYLVHAIGNSIANIQLWAGIVITVVSIAGLVALIVTRPKKTEGADTTDVPVLHNTEEALLAPTKEVKRPKAKD